MYMQTITKNDVIKGMNEGIIRVFDHYGITCMIGNFSFYFDGDEGDCYSSLEDFLEDYSQEEIAGLIAATIADEDTAYDNGIYNDQWNYIYNFIHRGENQEEDFINLTLSYGELGILKSSLLETLNSMERIGMQDSNNYREVENFYNSLIRK